jgi:hypothetical protein
MKKPTKNPFKKNTEESKLWTLGYKHGLSHSKNKSHIDCPVQKMSKKEIQLIWDKGFVAGRKDQKPIPENTPYCYTPLSGIEKDSSGKVFMRVKTCPYYGKRYPKDKDKSSIGAMGFCRLTRTVDDICLSDQCKICGIKDYEEQND